MNLLYPASYSAIGLIDSPHRLMLTASLAIGTLSAPIVLPVAEISPEMMPLEASVPGSRHAGEWRRMANGCPCGKPPNRAKSACRR